MLEVGNGGCTYDEYVAHFSLWSLLKSPLLIGCDVTKISNQTLGILTNLEVIAVNQDSLGISGYLVSKNGDAEVWGGPLTNGNVAVVLFNRGNDIKKITVQFSDFKIRTGAIVRDLWKHETLGQFTSEFSALVKPHAVVMVKLTPK